jgi:serine/threonine protein kinase
MKSTFHKRLPENIVKEFLRQLVRAVQYLHDANIIHRDIKPENVLLCDDGRVKLADFGCCCRLKSDTQRRKTFCGTLDYVAPEMVGGDGYGKSVDVWALGVLAYEMLVGRPPFDYTSPQETLTNILSVNFFSILKIII